MLPELLLFVVACLLAISWVMGMVQKPAENMGNLPFGVIAIAVLSGLGLMFRSVRLGVKGDPNYLLKKRTGRNG